MRYFYFWRSDVPTWRRFGLLSVALPRADGSLKPHGLVRWGMGGEKMIPPTETIVFWSVIPQISTNAMSWFIYVFKVYMWGVEHFFIGLCGWFYGCGLRGFLLEACHYSNVRWDTFWILCFCWAPDSLSVKNSRLGWWLYDNDVWFFLPIMIC